LTSLGFCGATEQFWQKTAKTDCFTKFAPEISNFEKTIDTASATLQDLLKMWYISYRAKTIKVSLLSADTSHARKQG
jgi:hypothetical protein